MRSLSEPWLVPMRMRAAEFLAALQHERRELFLDALQLRGVLLVGVFLDREFLGVGVVAGIDADHLDPLRRFHRGVRLEMNVGDDRHTAAALRASSATMFCRFAASFTVGAVMRTIWQPTATSSSVCFTRPRGVHRVAREHGLHDDRMIAADDDAAVARIAK